MLPKIREVTPLPDFHLRVSFDDGKMVLYNVMEDIKQIKSYRDLMSVYGLFYQVKLDESRTCVSWNDQIDLPSDTIYEYGKPCEEMDGVADA